MKIVMVAGFYPSVEGLLRQRFPGYFEAKSILWVPQLGPHREADVGYFRWALFDRLAFGVRDVTVLLAVFRGQELIKDTFSSILREGYAGFPDIDFRVVPFKDALAHDAVIAQVSALNLPAPLIQVPLAVPDLKCLEEWARKELHRKLLLHPRALRGARKSKFEDPGLIFESLNILGNEYRDVRLNGQEQCGAALTGRLNQHDLHITPAISSAAAGQFGKEYQVFYPIGQQRHQRLLTDHVKKGSDRDAATCLRIYFFWDDKAKLVVAGWLPSHLDIESS